MSVCIIKIAEVTTRPASYCIFIPKTRRGSLTVCLRPRCSHIGTPSPYFNHDIYFSRVYKHVLAIKSRHAYLMMSGFNEVWYLSIDSEWVVPRWRLESLNQVLIDNTGKSQISTAGPLRKLKVNKAKQTKHKESTGHSLAHWTLVLVPYTIEHQ